MRNLLFFFTFIFVIFSGYSQDISFQNGTFNQCGGTLTDSGGASGNYGDNENLVLTLCPDTTDRFIQLVFSSFSTQSSADILTIYDGADNTGNVIGTYSGGPANSPGTVSAAITSATGCITLQFVSDTATNTVGFEADIICLETCQTIASSINSTTPQANATGVIEIGAGTNLSLIHI